jgi:F-type H+-transporting ATPase subunit beta
MANAGTKSAGAVGTVVQITGPVVDIEFAARELPAIYNAVRVDRADGSLVVEVQQHLGNNRVRSVAMTTTDGLARGAKATDLGAPISVRPSSSKLASR